MIILVMRPKEKPHLVQEYLAQSKTWYSPISLAVEVAIEKKRFVAFKDTKIAGWQSSESDPTIEFARVEIIDDDIDNDDTD